MSDQDNEGKKVDDQLEDDQLEDVSGGKVVPQDISFTKKVDKATPTLMNS
jgi:type VI protein secretion system component Hcp